MHGMFQYSLWMFSSRTFMLPQLIFKAFLHFHYSVLHWHTLLIEFQVCTFSCLHFPTTLTEKLILTPFYTSTPLVKHLLPMKTWFCPGNLFVYFSSRLFWFQWSCNSVWYQALWSLHFVLLSQYRCSSFGSLMLPYAFPKCLFSICEIYHGYFSR